MIDIDQSKRNDWASFYVARGITTFDPIAELWQSQDFGASGNPDMIGDQNQVRLEMDGSE